MTQLQRYYLWLYLVIEIYQKWLRSQRLYSMQFAKLLDINCKETLNVLRS